MDLTQFSPELEIFDPSNESIGIETNFNFSFNKTERILKCVINLTFIQDNQPFLKCELQTFFEISKESIEEQTNDNFVIFPKGLLCQFASLAYGSFRGIIYMKTINTNICNLILPPMYLNEVIKGDMKIEL
jgi:hypothetical protein